MSPRSDSSPSSVAVVGVGAIGGVVAARLAARHAIVCCVRRPFETLRVVAPDGELGVRPRVEVRPEQVEPPTWLLLCTKAHHDAGPWLTRLVGRETHVAVLQNGVEHARRVARWAPPERVVPVVVHCPARAIAPGRVEQRAPMALWVPNDARSVAFSELFVDTGIECVPCDDFSLRAWRKLCANAVGGALAALSGLPLPEIDHPARARLARALALECAAVARAGGVPLTDDEAQQIAGRLATAQSGGNPSILLDRQRGVALEWDARNGVVVRLGRRLGIATPVSRSACELLARAHLAGDADLLAELAARTAPQ